MKKAVKQQMVSASLYNRMESGSSKAHNSADSLQPKENKDGSNKHSAQEFNDSSEKDQLWSKALDLLEQMKREGVKADAITYSSAIVACGSAGRWKEVLKLLKVMQKGGPTTRPNRIAYTNAITACGRSGEYQHALEVFNDMKRDGIKPDRVSYNALISALKVARQPDRIFSYGVR
jgi:pentatricopeptide repeat protein